MLQKLIYFVFVFMSSEFSNFYVFFLELFLDEHAMVLQYELVAMIKVKHTSIHTLVS
jgi:hypothetical protein